MIIHRLPPDGVGVTPCCGKTPFELPKNDQITAIGKITCIEDKTGDKVSCFLCLDLGGIALHEKWSKERGKPLWTAHEHPSDDPHPTYPCPVCMITVRPWLPKDGDKRCQECGRFNPCWFAPNELWNEVVGGNPNREAGGVLCPTCFLLRAPDAIYRVNVDR